MKNGPIFCTVDFFTIEHGSYRVIEFTVFCQFEQKIHRLIGDDIF